MIFSIFLLLLISSSFSSVLAVQVCGKKTNWEYDLGGRIESVAISSDGNYIVAGTEDGDVAFFNRSENTPLWTYQTNRYMPGGVAISENGNHCLAVDFDGMDYLESDSSILLWQKNETDNIVRFFSSPNLTDIVTYRYDWSDSPTIGYLNVFNATNSKAEKVWEKNFIDTPSIESNGQYIAVGTNLGNLSMYHKSSDHILWSHDFGKPIASIAMSSGAVTPDSLKVPVATN